MSVLRAMLAKRGSKDLVTIPIETPVEAITTRIYLIRNQKVMLDSILAELYQVTTSRLNEAVKRNSGRFPADFMFQLNREEAECLTSQFAMSNRKGRGGRRRAPYAFTELGVAMLSSVLNSERAVQMNIAIMRAFVQLRETLATNQDLAYRIAHLESVQNEHASIITIVVDEINALKDLGQQPEPPKRPIGFIPALTADPNAPAALPDRDRAP